MVAPLPPVGRRTNHHYFFVPSAQRTVPGCFPVRIAGISLNLNGHNIKSWLIIFICLRIHNQISINTKEIYRTYFCWLMCLKCSTFNVQFHIKELNI